MVIRLILSGERPPRPPALELSDEQWSVIKQCWSADPDQRPSIAEVIQSMSSSLGRVHETQQQKKNTFSLDVPPPSLRDAALRNVIVQLQQELLHYPPNHALRPSTLIRLGQAYLDQYGLAHAMDDLEAAQRPYQEALMLVPAADNMRHVALLGLGTGLHLRFYVLKEQELLIGAISHLRESLDCGPPQEQSHRVVALHELSRAFLTSFRETGNTADLRDAHTLGQTSLQSPSHKHRDYFSALSTQAITEYLLFEQSASQDATLLEACITACRDALRLQPSHQPPRSTVQALLAISIARDGCQPEDLKEAIDLLFVAAAEGTFPAFLTPQAVEIIQRGAVELNIPSLMQETRWFT